MSARIAACCLAVLLLCSAAAPAARADELTEAKRADIRLLIDTTGGAAMGKQLAAVMTRQLVEMLRKTRPDIPVQALATIERETIGIFNQAVDEPGGLVDRIVPLYADAFTHQDIREMLAFYQSPVGKKAVAAQPQLFKAAQKVGENYAREMAPEIRRRIKDALQKDRIDIDKQI